MLRFSSKVIYSMEEHLAAGYQTIRRIVRPVSLTMRWRNIAHAVPERVNHKIDCDASLFVANIEHQTASASGVRSRRVATGCVYSLMRNDPSCYFLPLK